MYTSVAVNYKVTCYYPFGLTMHGISSRAAGGIENKKKYQQYELNSDLDINLYESFYRSHDPQLGRFWQIDPKPNEFVSLYAAMNNNPISNVDLLGDTTYYYNVNGNLLRRQNDGNDYATISVISEKNMKAFGRMSSMVDKMQSVRAGSDNPISDKTVAGALRILGVNYDTKEYAAYYDKHSKDYYKGDAFKPTDGKGKLINEHMAGLELNGGHLRVMDRMADQRGNNPVISGTDEAGNADIHTHTAEGRSFTVGGRSASVGRGRAAFGDVLSGGDLSRGSYETPGQERYRSGVFNVAVSPTHVYLYRYGQLTIAVDRKSVPSKNPGDIK